MRTLTPIRCNHGRNTMCTRSRSKRARRFPAELRQTTANNEKLPLLLDPPRLGRALAGRNQRFLNFKPFKKGLFGPKSGDSSRDDSSPNSGTFLKFSTLRFCHVLQHVSQTFNFINFVMSSEKFLTLQIYRHVR